MSEIDLIVYGMLLAFTMIGTTEFVIGLLLLREYDKLQKEKGKVAWHGTHFTNGTRTGAKNYPNMIDWYSEELNSPRWTKLDIYRLHQYKTK